jgi:glucose/mannose-6-phosphate isomerase
MTSFVPERLDDPDWLVTADRAGLLRALASAGALVRRSLATAADSGLARLADAAPPRAVLVALDSGAPYLSSLLAATASDRSPVLDWRSPTLPAWAGPADALLVLSADGRHPRLAELAAQADHRGLALMSVAPLASPIAIATGRHPVVDAGRLSSVPARAVWWGLAAPALLAMDEFGLMTVKGLLSDVADALDEVAAIDRPDSSAFTGPAKLLAAELARSVPVIAGAGPAATVAARRIAGSVQLLAGHAAMAASLPDDIARVGALLEYAEESVVDLFADLAEPVGARPRLVLVGDDDDPVPFLVDQSIDPKWDSLGEEAARRAARALAGTAGSRGIGVSRILVPDGPPLVRFAAACATGDFAATYLALARGVDPSAPRLGELPH